MASFFKTLSKKNWQRMLYFCIEFRFVAVDEYLKWACDLQWAKWKRSRNVTFRHFERWHLFIIYHTPLWVVCILGVHIGEKKFLKLFSFTYAINVIFAFKLLNKWIWNRFIVDSHIWSHLLFSMLLRCTFNSIFRQHKHQAAAWARTIISRFAYLIIDVKSKEKSHALHDTTQFNTEMIVLIWECNEFLLFCFGVLPHSKSGVANSRQSNFVWIS